MGTKSKTVGSFEAKTHLSSLLEEVEDGSEITITRRGKPVAVLIPYTQNINRPGRKEIALKLSEIREGVKGKVNIRELIEEGRKY